MSVTFAYKWNLNNQDFTYQDARDLLRNAIVHPKGSALKTEIDEGTARVIMGPHKTPWGDKRLHVTVHCVKMMTTFHLYVSKQGNLTDIDREPQSPMKKPGHVNDDFRAPAIPNSAAL